MAELPITLVEFMYLVFTRMPGESYRRQLRSLLLCLCDVFRALINSLVCWFCRSALGLVLFQIWELSSIIPLTWSQRLPECAKTEAVPTAPYRRAHTGIGAAAPSLQGGHSPLPLWRCSLPLSALPPEAETRQVGHFTQRDYYILRTKSLHSRLKPHTGMCNFPAYQMFIIPKHNGWRKERGLFSMYPLNLICIYSISAGCPSSSSEDIQTLNLELKAHPPPPSPPHTCVQMCLYVCVASVSQYSMYIYIYIYIYIYMSVSFYLCTCMLTHSLASHHVLCKALRTS